MQYDNMFDGLYKKIYMVYHISYIINPLALTVSLFFYKKTKPLKTAQASKRGRGSADHIQRHSIGIHNRSLPETDSTKRTEISSIGAQPACDTVAHPFLGMSKKE